MYTSSHDYVAIALTHLLVFVPNWPKLVLWTGNIVPLQTRLLTCTGHADLIRLMKKMRSACTMMLLMHFFPAVRWHWLFWIGMKPGKSKFIRQKLRATMLSGTIFHGFTPLPKMQASQTISTVIDSARYRTKSLSNLFEY